MFLTAASVTAQGVQKGRVKTIGRPNKPGKGLQDVQINISDVANALVTRKDGSFSFYPKGDRYMLSRVKKNNYQLIDRSLIGRLFPFSPNIPVEIVMVSNQELMADKQRIEDRAYQRAEQKYKAKIELLEQQLKRNSLSEQEAQKKRAKLSESYQRYLQLISQMAERYAITDYDGVSGINQLILQCIENGDLERADSLINAKGSLEAREAELREQRKITEQAEAFVLLSRSNIAAKLKDLAQDYYNKHSIMLGNYQIDSAAIYLERRALLDTTHVEWTIETGMFISEYQADYDKAIRYYHRARRMATNLYGAQSLQVAQCNNLIGKSLMENGMYIRAIDYFSEARATLEALPEQNSAELLECYANMAAVFMKVESLPYLNARAAMALAMKQARDIYAPQDLRYANILMKNAELSLKSGDATSAVQDMYRIQEIYKNQQGISRAELARNHYHLGIALTSTRDYLEGRKYLNKALDIWKQLFGEKHPYVSYVYDALGDNHLGEKSFIKADSCYRQALAIQKEAFGGIHPAIVKCHEKQARLYRRQAKFAEAVLYNIRAIDVMLQLEAYSSNQIKEHFQHVDSWLSGLRASPHSEQQFHLLHTELDRLYNIYRTSPKNTVKIKNFVYQKTL